MTPSSPHSPKPKGNAAEEELASGGCTAGFVLGQYCSSFLLMTWLVEKMAHYVLCLTSVWEDYHHIQGLVQISITPLQKMSRKGYTSSRINQMHKWGMSG